MTEEQIFWKLGEGKADFWHDKWALPDPILPLSKVDNPLPLQMCDFYLGTNWDTQELQWWVPPRVVTTISNIVFQPRRRMCWFGMLLRQVFLQEVRLMS